MFEGQLERMESAEIEEHFESLLEHIKTGHEPWYFCHSCLRKRRVSITGYRMEFDHQAQQGLYFVEYRCHACDEKWEDCHLTLAVEDFCHMNPEKFYREIHGNV